MAHTSSNNTKPITNDVSIELVDKTAREDVHIIIFARNTSSAVKGPCIVWETICAKHSKIIKVPASFMIEAKTLESPKMCKRILGNLRKCYEIIRTKNDSPIDINEVPCKKDCIDTCITVSNLHSNLPGSSYDVSILKNNNPLLLQKEIPTGAGKPLLSYQVFSALELHLKHFR
jgi:hypothetical protein